MCAMGIRKLFVFKGFCIDDIRVSEDIAQITLRRDECYRLECLHCGKTMGFNRSRMQTCWSSISITPGCSLPHRDRDRVRDSRPVGTCDAVCALF